MSTHQQNSSTYPHNCNSCGVSGNSNAYVTLGSYNSGGKAFVNNPPQMAGSGVQIVPVFGASGYDALQHGTQPEGNNYFSINNAYQSYPNACTSFTTRNCAASQPRQ